MVSLPKIEELLLSLMKVDSLSLWHSGAQMLLSITTLRAKSWLSKELESQTMAVNHSTQATNILRSSSMLITREQESFFNGTNREILAISIQSVTKVWLLPPKLRERQPRDKIILDWSLSCLNKFRVITAIKTLATSTAVSKLSQSSTRSMVSLLTLRLMRNSSILAALNAEEKSMKSMMATDVRTAIRSSALASLLTSWMPSFQISLVTCTFNLLENWETKSCAGWQLNNLEITKKRMKTSRPTSQKTASIR